MTDTRSDLREGESSDEASFEYLIGAAHRLLEQDNDAQLEALAERLKALKDSESALGELESLRLQMALDRMTKLEHTLSSLLKKFADTRCAIIDNLK